jgi:hypothetical protein
MSYQDIGKKIEDHLLAILQVTLYDPPQSAVMKKNNTTHLDIEANLHHVVPPKFGNGARDLTPYRRISC